MLARPRSAAPRSSGLWAPDPLLRALLDAVPSAVAIVDSSGQIAFCNAAWTGMGVRTAPFGELGTLVAPSDHEGAHYVRRLLAMTGPLAMPAHRLGRAVQDALSGRATSNRLAYRARRPEREEPFEALVTAMPLEGAALALVQHLDVADHEAAVESAAAALRSALEVEDLRARRRRMERRVAAVGQTLHVPLTPVRLELHLLQSGALGPLTDRQAKALDLVARNVQRWADGEAAFLRLPLDPEAPATQVDLTEAGRDAVDERQTQAMQQGIRLALYAPPEPVFAHAPADVVRDALDLLLERALQASPAGSVVALEARQRSDDAVLEMRDSGPGLSERDVRRLFEPGAGQPHDKQSDAFVLHHLRKVVEQAGGRIWAESDGPGQGLLVGLGFPLPGPGGSKPGALS